MTALRIGSLCSGYGGLDMGLRAVVGGDVAWFCENDKDPARILAHHWPDIPNHHDLMTLDWTTVEPVDWLIGGIPCQPFSNAGLRLALGDPRHLWPFMADGVRVLRPRNVLVENVSGFIVRGGLDCVLGSLAALGYDAQWISLRAADVGAPHGRERVFVVATDARRLRGHAGRVAAPGQETGGRSLAVPGVGRGMDVAADANGRGHGGEQDSRRVGGVDRRDATEARKRQRARSVALDRSTEAATDWGVYGPAVRRWEAVLGRPAPAPSAPNGRGGWRLSPRFVEWMMGLPDGHVTDVPGLSRNAQLKALGNGVVPQQAALALRTLLGAP